MCAGAGKGGDLENVQRAIEQVKGRHSEKGRRTSNEDQAEAAEIAQEHFKKHLREQIFDAVLISSGTQLALLLHPHVSWLCPLRPPPGSARRHLQALTLSTTVISG